MDVSITIVEFALTDNADTIWLVTPAVPPDGTTDTVTVAAVVVVLHNTSEVTLTSVDAGTVYAVATDVPG
jgi:hypothetical protein